MGTTAGVLGGTSCEGSMGRAGGRCLLLPACSVLLAAHHEEQWSGAFPCPCFAGQPNLALGGFMAMIPH